MMKNAVIVIPVYKTNLHENELLSLRRSLQVLARHDFAIACPEGLDLDPLVPLLQSVSYTVKRFPADYFKGLSGYNQLMLSEAFYKAFEDYAYILICQMDVFVFEDKLDDWCSKGYDYIGAPWLASKQTFLSRLLFKINNTFRKRKKSNEHYFRVGNGGFSLRKTVTMLRAVSRRNECMTDASSSLAQWQPQNLHIEDLYFSLVAPTLVDMKIPDYREAVDFCVDRRPKLALQLNRGKLPFACHRFYDPKVKGFWDPIIRKYA
ncbi:DUF5672 family protein [Dyella caseinilytica]|uniref:DUF5672 domain-containing protein n=1 Tax=Dyella caseinilytica TaxID=1849581 RepID=A0ABX7GNT5_9GAMM|nr:DUF5672 family protein [Dyella caseinilytica]QRN52043.1 hypothetical protein ISN74_11040 [Dyella caseinilytica]GGA04453.1 hypothetical protein GCM10011408_27860 [Dyella caseinilytica]